MKRIAIYGFGRIGRQLMRICLDRNLLIPFALANVKSSTYSFSAVQRGLQLWEANMQPMIDLPAFIFPLAVLLLYPN